MKRLFFILICLTACAPQPLVSMAETPPADGKPKLVIGIVIDQMRYDYLTRYYDDFGQGGFRRLMDQGFVSHNHHYSYAPTFTGPGHASIYTGTTPSTHGIIANDWFDRNTGTVMYCAADSMVTPVGTSNPTAKMSAFRLLSSTLSEELELATQGASKTIGIALKDRSSLLPMGQGGDAAYWFMGGTEGNFVTCSDYMDALPAWVDQFNNSSIKSDLMLQTWNLLLDPSAYNESHADNNPFEGAITGKVSPTFPYNLQELGPQNDNYSILKTVPQGNELTLAFAKWAIENEQMGADDITDLLAISFSANDYVGHRFGVDAMETQDIYLRLDRQLEAFFNYLDEQIGLDQVTIFLTADHGSPHVPSYLEKEQIPGGYWQPGNMIEDVKAMLNEKLGEGEWVLSYFNDQFFLNHDLMRQQDVEVDDVEEMIAALCLEYEGVHTVITAETLKNAEFTRGIYGIIQNGFLAKLSGDVMVVTNPGWITYNRTGTTHGSPFAYDTHVPLIIYGAGVETGQHYDYTRTADIAPTLSAIMKIQMPSGTTGSMISPAIQR
ncbi:MAG: alkaline phosphatase family protein [Flavobacteriales bacterium]|nr:alkaline phosphatase family protein [Flavobacteriales bacterium]